MLKRFFEKIRADGFQVVAEEIAEAEALLVTKILAALGQQPAGFLQHRVTPFAFHAAGFLVADIVERLVLLATMWNRSKMCSASEHFSWMTFKYDSHMSEQIKEIFGGDFLVHGGEESLKGFDGSFSPDPEQADDADVDLVDQDQVFVAFGVLDFIDANGVDLTQRAMLQSSGDDMFDRIEHLVPGSAKALCGFFPRKPARPTG